MRILKHFLLLSILLAFTSRPLRADFPTLAPAYGPPMQLLGDTAFTNGFRAFWSCSSFNGNQDLQLGDCVDYTQPVVNRYGKNYSIHTWPDTGVPSDFNKSWNFGEGVHTGRPIRDSGGNVIGQTPISVDGYQINWPEDLAVHRFEANATCYSDATSIWLQNTNNLGSPNSSDPNYDPNYGQLVRTMQTNRAGTLLTYAVTRNELSNIARNYGSEYAYNTWPTYLLEQNFKQLIDLANFDSVVFNVNLQIFPVGFLQPAMPNSDSEATYSIYFTLRKKDAAAAGVLFLGYSPYSVWPDGRPAPEYLESLGPEQFSQPVYRGNVNDIGGPSSPDGSTRTVTIDLRALFNKAVAKSGSHLNGAIFEDYYLSSMSVGWETIGYEAIQSQVSAVSLVGSPRMIFDAEVYQDSYYAANNGDLPWTGDGSAALRRAHWVHYGVSEGRVASPTFSAVTYLQKYPDVAAAYGATNYLGAITHYIQYGRAEGRTGHW